MNNDDSFSIYDNVVAEILPYYYYRYCKEKIKINNKIMQEKGYKWYCDRIDEVIKAVADDKGEKYNISRKDLDYLLWYYYKGDKDIKDDKKNICYKSRITRALDNIK